MHTPTQYTPCTHTHTLTEQGLGLRLSNVSNLDITHKHFSYPSCSLSSPYPADRSQKEPGREDEELGWGGEGKLGGGRALQSPWRQASLGTSLCDCTPAKPDPTDWGCLGPPASTSLHPLRLLHRKTWLFCCPNFPVPCCLSLSLAQLSWIPFSRLLSPLPFALLFLVTLIPTSLLTSFPSSFCPHLGTRQRGSHLPSSKVSCSRTTRTHSHTLSPPPAHRHTTTHIQTRPGQPCWD